jgi:enoyl-[acyl-carrier protein] reductase II
LIRTPLCNLLGIDHPIMQGPLGGPWPPGLELVAAVSNAGALGSLPTALRSAEQVRDDIAAVRRLTERPFAVNHTFRPFIPEVFQAMLDGAPPVISIALGPAGELPKRAHDVGSVYIHQIHTAEQATEAVEAGADAVIAQGNEAGGFGGAAGALVLVPQVVDAVRPIPVVAAGGIADGRGLAAALVLGAHGVNLGTRFLASEEAGIPASYREAVLRARPEEIARVPLMNELVPPATAGAYEGAPRLLRTRFAEVLIADPERSRPDIDDLRRELSLAMKEERAHELLPLMGESAGLVHDVRPAAEIVRLMTQEAEAIIGAAAETIA